MCVACLDFRLRNDIWLPQHHHKYDFNHHGYFIPSYAQNYAFDLWQWKQVYGRGHRKLTSWKLSQCKPMRLIAYDIFRCIKSTKIYSSEYDIASYVHLIQLQSSVRSSAFYPGGWNHLFSLSAGWSIEYLCENRKWNLCLAEWQSIIFAVVRYFPQGIV